jgi:predicted methyltransferase
MNRLILAAAATAALGGVALVSVPLLADHHAGADADAQAFAATHAEALAGAINHPTRAEDKARDAHRHPAETLAFFRVAPDMKVGEYAPGGGWYSRLLGHYLGGEGKLVGLFVNPAIASTDPVRQERVRNQAAGFADEVAGFTGLPADRFAGMTLENLPEDQKGTFDRILVIRAMHNVFRGNIADSEIKAMRELLAEDGMIGIVQHRAKSDAPWSYANGTKGYLREADVIDFMRINGFELVAKSEVNANPRDTADHPQGVWEMPPSLATKREDLAGLGESDRMTLLFKKAD